MPRPVAPAQVLRGRAGLGRAHAGGGGSQRDPASIGAQGHVPRLAIVITGMPGAGKTHTACRVKDLLQTLFGIGVVQQYNAVPMVNAAAQTISRAMTVFGGEMAMIGDFFPIDSPETEIDIGFEAHGAFRSAFARHRLEDLFRDVKQPVIITEGLTLGQRAIDALKQSRKLLAFDVTTDLGLAEARYQKRGLTGKDQSYEVRMRAYEWNCQRLGDVKKLDSDAAYTEIRDALLECRSIEPH